MIVNIKTDKDNIITGYAVVGKMEGGIDVETGYEDVEEVPPLSIGYYKFIDDEIVIDEELKEQIEVTQ